ncbi:Protein CBG05512 [Caenorhabditis briggsae]|uniref:Protein CBG05512 n=1 Tax=Caenorhabditis briggsae TaxID=6238 RepID=A8X021_CAEBR|nr:Protein CBG05512 [Caenorhabditis briggsae]CAP25981.2 Protein CBG05512 [Caenorhabditis briggsae]
MFPPIAAADASSSKLRWQKSTRRISYVKLPSIQAKEKKRQVPSVPSEEEPIPSDPAPSLPPIPTITPSLCIDNQYFANYISEKPKIDDVDYLSRAFSSCVFFSEMSRFAKIQGSLHAQRTNYFEKRGLLEAIELNIEQQNSKISEALGCLAVCNQITEKYQCNLDTSFQVLVDDFSEKAFRLSSLTSQLHALRQTHQANLQVRKNEASQLEDIGGESKERRRESRNSTGNCGNFMRIEMKTGKEQQRKLKMWKKQKTKKVI